MPCAVCNTTEQSVAQGARFKRRHLQPGASGADPLAIRRDGGPRVRPVWPTLAYGRLLSSGRSSD